MKLRWVTARRDGRLINGENFLKGGLREMLIFHEANENGDKPLELEIADLNCGARVVVALPSPRSSLHPRRPKSATTEREPFGSAIR